MHRARLLLILLLTVVAARRAGAQARIIYGGFVSAYGTNQTGFEASGGLGLFLGRERDLSHALSVAGVGTVLHTIRTSDDIAICRLGPNDTCLPRPLFPLWLTTLEVEATAALVPFLPLRLVGAGGISLAYDAREYWKDAPRTNHGSKTQSIWRGGFELRMGRSPTSPRLRYTRTSFGADPFGLASLKSIHLILGR